MFFIFLAAFVLSSSGLLFDSYFVKNIFIPYPIFFLAMGFIGAFFLFVSFQPKVVYDKRSYFVLIPNLAFVFFSLVSSVISGAGDILALPSKLFSIFLNVIYFYLGYSLFFSKYKVFFAKTFIFSSVFICVVVLALFNDSINKNWIGITIVYGFVFLMLLYEKRRVMSFSCIFVFVSLFSFLVLSSRGASIAAFLASTYLFVNFIGIKKIELWINRFSPFIFASSSFFVSLLGVWLYNSVYYSELVYKSIVYTGKSLDSSRLERWNLGAQLFMERPLLGWGLDAHVGRASNLNGYGDLHNFWWEILFRGGIFGAFCFIFIFAFLIFRVLLYKPMAEDNVAFIVLFLFMSVYALGGVTHWPGSYMFWLVLGILLARSRNKELDIYKA